MENEKEKKDENKEKKGFNFSFLESIRIEDDEKIIELEKQEEERQEEERKRKLEENYKKIAPFRYLNESLETYKASPENKKSYDWILGFCKAVENHKNKKNLIYLNGKSGTGKTHLALGMIRELGGQLITSLELCITYDSCRDFNSSKTRIQFLKDLCRQKVLVIDEIGKGIERIEKEIVPYIINEFYNDSGKILIFTGNEKNEDFEKLIGESSTDRFNGNGIYLSLVGESQRKK